MLRAMLCVALPMVSLNTVAGDAFQGLQWGATEQQIRAKFGEKLKAKVCDKTGEELDRSSPTVYCGRPTVQPYTVADVPFELGFSLSKDTRKLAAVTMFSSGDGLSSQESALLLERYRRLKSLLIQRYGAPSLDKNEPRDRNKGALYNALWLTKDSSISLSLSLMNFQGDGDFYMLQVWYRPLIEDEAKRL